MGTILFIVVSLVVFVFIYFGVSLSLQAWRKQMFNQENRPKPLTRNLEFEIVAAVTAVMILRQESLQQTETQHVNHHSTAIWRKRSREINSCRSTKAET